MKDATVPKASLMFKIMTLKTLEIKIENRAEILMVKKKVADKKITIVIKI